MNSISLFVLHSSDGADYNSQPITLTFGPGVDRNCFNVTIIDDDSYEVREDFFVNLTTSEPLVTVMPMSTVVRINDLDGEYVAKGGA